MSTQSTHDIAQEIRSTHVRPQTLAIWWLGQASLVLRAEDVTLYIDPFLSDYPGRMLPPPFSPREAPPANYILCTHDHVDHFDPQTLPGLLEVSPGARLVIPRPVVAHATDLGIAAECVVGTQPGEKVRLGPVALHSVPACHGLHAPPARYGFDCIEQEGTTLYPYLGYIIEIAGMRLYHAGDTVIYDGLVERLREFAIDIAFLPINGRTYFREHMDIVGNMDEREAADLAAAAGIPLLVPIHYDMFAANLGRPGVLVDYIQKHHPDLSCFLPAYGRRFLLTNMEGTFGNERE
jgi:L-ascorbate 6-phosphate lactonase